MLFLFGSENEHDLWNNPAMHLSKNRGNRSGCLHAVTLVDLLVAVSIMSIAMLVFISAALTARGVLDKSRFITVGSQTAGSQAATSLGNASALAVGATNSAITGIPQGVISTTLTTYGGSTYLKRADISVSWGAASSKTAYSAGAFDFSTLIATPSHISGLFNTGVDNAGALLSQSSIDSHYTIVSGPYTGVVYVPPPDPNWTARTGNSQWISPSPNRSQSMPIGTYVYRTTFTLTGLTSGVSIGVSVSPDDSVADVRLNGVSVASNIGGPAAWANFNIAGSFITGSNTLDFYVTNTAAGPAGIQLQLTPSS